MFNLYFAGSYSPVEDVLQELKCKRLFSQFNDRTGLRRWMEDEDNTGRKHTLFVDSGAYTANTKGVVIDLDLYIAYLNDCKGRFEVIAPLDVIPDSTLESQLAAPKQSWENYLIMKERVIDGDHVIPAFHMGEDFMYLKQILDAGTEYMALGGMVGSTTKDKIAWYEKCFRIVRESDNKNIKIHAFGMTSLKLLEMYPFYSADSTSWLMTAAMGNVMTTKGTLYVGTDYTDTGHIKYQPAQVRQMFESLCKDYDVDIHTIEEDYREREKFNVHYLQQWANNYEFKGKTTHRRSLF